MLFNGRRQSRDSVLLQDILHITKGAKLWMNSYTAAQFPGSVKNLYVDEAFLEMAEAGSFCFVEDADILPYAEKIEGFIIYRWNRDYPSDMKFPIEQFSDRWQHQESCEFPGSSHRCIAREVYLL